MRKKFYGTKQYAASVVKINKKIAVFRKAIRRIEAKERYMHSIRVKIIEFNGIDVRKLPSKIWDKEKVKTRRSFYKYCLEHGCRGNEIASFLGFKLSGSITRKRLVFTKSFKTNKDNLNFWHKFTQFMNRDN